MHREPPCSQGRPRIEGKGLPSCRKTAVAVFAALALSGAGCVNYDLASVPSKDMGVGHLYERLPATAKVAGFRDRTEEQKVPTRLLGRCTDSFAVSLKNTDIFEKVLKGTGERAEIGFEGSVTRISCEQNFGFIWTFYSFFLIIAVPANLPLSIDDATYEVTVRAVHVPSDRTLGTYKASVHLHSWRGAWTLFESFLDDPGQVYDRANREVLTQIVDDYPKFRDAILARPPVLEAPR